MGSARAVLGAGDEAGHAPAVMRESSPVEARVAVVVGASSGIGRAAAGGGSVSVFPMDVTDHGSVDALLDGALLTYGRVDTVVHTAAVIGYGLFEQVPAEEFDRAVMTNLLGTAAVSRAALRVFRSSGRGHLVLVGSLLGKLAVPFMSPYVVGKWGVHALARTLQIETRDARDIHVSLITPGSVARAVLQVLRRPRRDRAVGPLNGLMVTARPEGDRTHGRWGRLGLRRRDVDHEG